MELHGFGGDFAGKIEEVGLDAEGRTVESGANADVGDRAAALRFAGEKGAGDVDAASGQKLLVGLEVEGREGKAAAGAGAGNNFAGERKRAAEEARGVGEVAGGNFAANHGAGDD